MNLRSHVKITQFIPLTPHVLEWTGSSQTAVREEREGRESASLVYEEIFALRRSRVSSKEGVGRNLMLYGSFVRGVRRVRGFTSSSY